jgi:L-threonylcarbamoyladenylate synthase
MGTAPILDASDDSLARAAALLKAGRLVALPTETVYGLAADAANGQAVARIYEAKGRPSFNPLIAHVSGLDMARREAIFSPMAEALAEAFWPGPLTLVLPVAETGTVSALARAGLDSLALRMPAHTAMQGVIGRLGRPLVAPSANTSGHVSPTLAAHVAEDLGERIDLIVDGGPCATGLESTIVSVLDGKACVLRPGPIPREAIEVMTGALVAPGPDPSDGTLRAPGLLASHYAPRARVRLNALHKRAGEALLGFGNVPEADLNLSARADLKEAAANLFAHLRALDQGVAIIAVSPIPLAGLGEAINDRLNRAAADR